MAEEKKVKDISIKATLDRLNKLYGAGTVVSGNTKHDKIEAVSTGSRHLDREIGIGGLPYGRIVEIIGPESSGKTTLILNVIANAQKEGKGTAIIDMEHALSSAYAKSLEVDMDKVLLSQPAWGEQALDVAIELIKTDKIKVIAIDSVAALVPKAEVDGTVGDQRPGLQARMMSQALRILTPLAEHHNCLVLFTNQIRMKIGVMYGSPETPAGGEALKFYASVRLDMRKTPDKANELNKTRIKVIKNKVGKPFGEVEIGLIWGQGFDKWTEIIDMAIDLNIIQKSGSWFAYGETKIGQGFEAVVQLLKDNPELMTEITAKTLEAINPSVETVKSVI